MFRVVERLACFPAVTGQEAGYQSSKAFNPQAASCLNTNSLAPEIRCATLSLGLSGANKTNSPFPLGPTLHCLSLSSFLCFFVWSNCTKLFISQLYSHIWTTLCHNSSPEQTTTMSFSKNSSHFCVLKKGRSLNVTTKAEFLIGRSSIGLTFIVRIMAVHRAWKHTLKRCVVVRGCKSYNVEARNEDIPAFTETFHCKWLLECAFLPLNLNSIYCFWVTLSVKLDFQQLKYSRWSAPKIYMNK